MSRTDKEVVDFLRFVKNWEKLALAHAEAAEAYRHAHAVAFNAPDKATDTARKSIADAATSELRIARDRAEIEALAAHHWVIFFRGSAGETV